jgi:hypothetical protein
VLNIGIFLHLSALESREQSGVSKHFEIDFELRGIISLLA